MSATLRRYVFSALLKSVWSLLGLFVLITLAWPHAALAQSCGSGDIDPPTLNASTQVLIPASRLALRASNTSGQSSTPCQAQCATDVANCHAGCGANQGCHNACDAQYQSCLNNCPPPPPTSVSGSVLPKFVILSVIYAPPGQKSTVAYGNSTVMGTTTSWGQSFQYTDTLTASFTGSIGPSGSGAESWSQTSDSSGSIAITKTSTSGLTVPGPSDSNLDIDHRLDQIVVWLNPKLDIASSSNNSSQLEWKYTYDPGDPWNGMDVIRLYVTWLQHPTTMPPGIISRLQRSWAGTGQGLITTDYNTILAADPFANGPGSVSPARFTPVGGQNFSYEPPPCGGQPSTTTYSVNYQNSTTSAESETYQYGVDFTVGYGLKLSDLLNFGIKDQQTLKWTDKWGVQFNNSTSQTASFSLTGPSDCHYSGATAVNVYQDNIYGTFMFDVPGGATAQGFPPPPPATPPPDPNQPPPPPPPGTLNATVAVSVPANMVAGQQYTATFTATNTGTANWNPVGRGCNAFLLGSQNPQDNTTWGIGRVPLPAVVPAGSSITVSAAITAPTTPGVYNFQWQMLEECVTWFGSPSNNIAVAVNVPPPGFDPVFYLDHYPDLKAAFGTNYQAALNHWLTVGANEGRRPSRQLDPVFYLNHYPDLLAAFGAGNYLAAYNHWITSGLNEGRRSSREFDVAFYLNHQPDLLAAFGAGNYPAALNHWLTFGIHEGRRSAYEFDVAFYLNHYPDLLAAFGAGNYPAAFDHWLTYGLNEGRASSVNFDVGFYLNHYPDLIAAFGPKNYPAAFDHWIVFGRGEGRQGAPGVLNSGFEQITSLTPGVLSPGFEGNSAQGWNLGYWGASSSVTSAQSHSGGYSLAQTGSTTGGSYQDVGGLVSGVTYQVSVWVRADSGTTAQAYLWVHDTTGANAGNTAPITPGQSWQQITLPYTADSTGKVRIHLHYIAGAGAIYYDDVQIGQYTGQGWNLGYGGASSSVTSAQSHSGGYSLAQTGSTTGGSYQDVGGLVSGVSYQVSVWVRADSGTTAQAILWVHDTTGANAGSTAPITPGQSWQQIALPYTADSTGKVRIHLHYIAGAGTIYYDDVQITTLSVLASGFEGNSSSSQVSSFLDPTGATTGKPADLLAALGQGNYPAAYNHFIASGLNEGRASSVNFDVGFYLNHYPDLIAAFGPKNYPAAFDHWIVFGRGEGRQGAP